MASTPPTPADRHALAVAALANLDIQAFLADPNVARVWTREAIERAPICRNVWEHTTVIATTGEALGEEATKVSEEATLVRSRLAAVKGEINYLVGVLAKLGAGAAELVQEGLSRLKTERELLQDKLKELDAAKAPHDIVREQAAKFVTGWTDIGQLFDEADLAEERIILQHLVHSLVLTVADKGTKHGT